MVQDVVPYKQQEDPDQESLEGTWTAMEPGIAVKMEEDYGIPAPPAAGIPAAGIQSPDLN